MVELDAGLKVKLQAHKEKYGYRSDEFWEAIDQAAQIVAEHMGEWRPIESAPRDGTNILIFDSYVYIASWSEEANDQRFTHYPGWQIYDCDDGYYSIASQNPTHWRPLPPPPGAPS